MAAVVQNICYNTFIEPFHRGVETIEYCLNGRRVDPLSRITRRQSEVGPPMIKRIAGCIVGIFLFIPIINAIVFAVIKALDWNFFIHHDVTIIPNPRDEIPEAQVAEVAVEERPHSTPISVPALTGAALNAIYTVDRLHLAAAADRATIIPEPPQTVIDLNGRLQHVRVRNLKDFMDLLNFEDPGFPGYRNPYTISDDGNRISRNDLRSELASRIDTIISNITARTPFQGVPQDPTEKEAFYNKLENFVKCIVHSLYMQRDVDIINSVIIDLACMATHCGGRYMSEAQRIHNLLKNSGDDFDEQTIGGKIKKKLTDCRCQILLQIIERECPGWSGGAMAPHVYNFFLKHIGGYDRTLGVNGREIGGLSIPGAVAGDYDDPYGRRFMPLHERESLIRNFHEYYTPEKVLLYIYEAFNGVETDPTTINRDIAIQWFKDLFTRVEKPAFVSTFEREHRQEIENQLRQDMQEAQEQRAAALDQRNQLDGSIQEMEPATKSLVQELIAIQINLEEHLETLSEQEKTALLRRYAISTEVVVQNDRGELLMAFQRRIAQAMRSLESAQASPIFAGIAITFEKLRELKRVIFQYINANRTINQPLPGATEESILQALQDKYMDQQVLEDLGEGRGQRIRPEAVVNCLVDMGFLRQKNEATPRRSYS